MLLNIKFFMLDLLISLKTKLRLLVVFLINITNRRYVPGLIEELNESTNVVREKLNNLSEVGYLGIHFEQNQNSCRASEKHLLFTSLQDIVHNYLCLYPIVAKMFGRMATNVNQNSIICDFSQKRDTGLLT